VTDKQYKEQLNRLTKVVARVKDDLWLDDWDIKVTPCRQIVSDADTSEFQTVMQCKVNWPYKLAHLTVFVPELVDRDDDWTLFAVTHELLHVIVNEMRNYDESDGIQHEERVVTHLTQIICDLRKRAKKDGKSTPSSKHG
jgi:hypothetical protein